ncbi:MAG: hypothetical protein RLZZ618_379 [Pseudomonadota bacterium]|jgi:peroxiredoxin
MKQKRHLAIALAGLTLVLAGALAAWHHQDTPVRAPDVAFVRLDGTPARTGDFKGKVLLVNFWATDCTTCVKEMPQLIATHEKYKSQGYETLAVAMQHDAPSSVANFTESRRLPFTVTVDNLGTVAHSFGDVRLTPTSVLINKRGEIVKRYVGEPDFAALNQLIERLLAEAA